MAFPTTAELDTFGGSFPGSNWTGGGIVDPDNFAIVSGALRNTAGDNSVASAYWSGATFGPNTEVFTDDIITVPAEDGDRDGLAGWTINHGSVDGYGLTVRDTLGQHQFRLQRFEAGVDTDIGTSPNQTVSIGDKFGLKVTWIGNRATLTSYVDTGSGWTPVEIFEDTADPFTTGVANIGLYNWEDKDGDQPGVGNFGGGAVVSGPTTQARVGRRTGIGGGIYGGRR